MGGGLERLRGDNPLLTQELNEALEQNKIEFPAFDAELMKKYYPSFNYAPYTKAELAALLQFADKAGYLLFFMALNIRMWYSECMRYHVM